MTAGHYVSKAIVADDSESFFERWLIMPKILYTTLNMFVYAFHGLMSIIFVEKFKFEYYQVGFASSVIAFNFFGSMIWANLADRTGRHKLIIIVTSAIYTVVACLLGYFAPDKPTMLVYLGAFFGFALYNFFLSAAFPLLDAQILGMLSKNPKHSKDQFNNQRVWGALGHFIATLCSFYFFSKTDPKPAIIFQVVSSVLFIAAVWFGVRDVKPVKHGHHHGGHSDKHKEAMAPSGNPTVILMTNPSFVFFMLFVACLGIIRSVSSTFQKLIAHDAMSKCPFISNELKGDARAHAQRVQSAYVDFGRMLSEVAVYLLAKPLKNAFGVYWILVFSQLTGILRVWGYGVINTEKVSAFYYAWAIELLKGFSSGLVSSSAIPIASAIAPAGCESTAQGLYSGNYSGLSNLFGGVLAGGILWYYFKKRPEAPAFETELAKKQYSHPLNRDECQKMFCWVSGLCVVVTALMMAKFIFMDRVMGLPGFPRKHSLGH